MRQQVSAILGNLTQELGPGKLALEMLVDADTYPDKPLPRSFGVQECKIDSGLIYQRAICSILQSNEESSEELRWTLRC
jgi:hypothetical protein